jgi:hypothetical protein
VVGSEVPRGLLKEGCLQAESSGREYSEALLREIIEETV